MNTQFKYKINLPIDTEPRSIPVMIDWLDEYNIVCDVNFAHHLDEDGFSYKKIKSYSFNFENEEDALTFKLRWQ